MHLELGPLPSRSARLWVENARVALAGVRRAGNALPVTLPSDIEATFVDYLDEWDALAASGDPFVWSADVDDDHASHLIVYFFGLLSLDDQLWAEHGLPFTPEGAEPFIRALSEAVVAGLDAAKSELAPPIQASWPRGEVLRPWRAEKAKLFRVVVVDDTEDVRLMLDLSLKVDGRFDLVGIATNGREAIDVCRDLQPDGILLDVMMPVLDGMSALPEIRAACPHARIVMLSANDHRSLVERALELGADAFVGKGTALDDAFAVLLGGENR